MGKYFDTDGEIDRVLGYVDHEELKKAALGTTGHIQSVLERYGEDFVGVYFDNAPASSKHRAIARIRELYGEYGVVEGKTKRYTGTIVDTDIALIPTVTGRVRARSISTGRWVKMPDGY